MTSVIAHGVGAVTSELVGQIVASQFATVFGYPRILTASKAELSAMIDPAALAGEARE